MLDRAVILTGFMGSGKSSVGRLVAEALDCTLVDLDQVIVEEAGKSINAIFEEEGEPVFRAMESECLKRFIHSGLVLIATGGGIVTNDRNRELMREHGYVINLKASLTHVLSRLENSSDRPLFKGKNCPDQVKSLMEQREQFYADADIRIDTDGKSVEDVATEIIMFLRGMPE